MKARAVNCSPEFGSRQAKSTKKNGETMGEQKEKRRGGQRDDSTLTIGLNRKELAELLEHTRRKCEEHERRHRFAIKYKLLNIKML